MALWADGGDAGDPAPGALARVPAGARTGGPAGPDPVRSRDRPGQRTSPRVVHDAADHGISAGALADRAPGPALPLLPDRVLAPLRLGRDACRTSAPPARRRSPGSTCRAGHRDRIRAPHCRLAHLPPAPDWPSGRHFISSTTIRISEFLGAALQSPAPAGGVSAVRPGVFGPRPCVEWLSHDASRSLRFPARLCRAPGRFPAFALLALGLAAPPALAQTPVPEVRGRVVAGETKTPLPGVTVTVEERGTVRGHRRERGLRRSPSRRRASCTCGPVRPGSCRSGRRCPGSAAPARSRSS